MATSWRVESKTVKVRPGALIDPYEPEMGEDHGDRYRYVCNRCNKPGPWRKDPNLADGDDHLYAKHGIGD